MNVLVQIYKVKWKKRELKLTSKLINENTLISV